MAWRDVFDLELVEEPFPLPIDPVDLVRILDNRGEPVFWLDGGALAESVVGYGDSVPLGAGSVLTDLRVSLPLEGARQSRSLGLVGWLAFDLAAETLGVAVSAGSEGSSFMRVREAIAIHPSGAASLLCPPSMAAVQRRARVAELSTEIAAASRSDTSVVSFPPGAATWHDSDARYVSKIRASQQQIRSGEVYQLCLTTRVTAETELDPISLYDRLRRSNGSGRGGLIHIGDVWLLSNSPELFLSVDHSRNVATSPVKGTRRRSSDPSTDRALVEELRTSVKERAENVMIVDLMRNDLSRVCDPGSVTVARLFDVETHPQVHQLVSSVVGRLRENVDFVDLLAATFPAGSMTGAPKRRAVEILEDVECGPRGPYAGAFGCVGSTGALELSMTIRTIVYTAGAISIGTGGGITALSTSADEVDEVHLKARALLSAAGVESAQPVLA